MAEINQPEQTPIEALMQQIENLSKINADLLDFHSNEKAEILEVKQVFLNKIKSTFDYGANHFAENFVKTVTQNPVYIDLSEKDRQMMEKNYWIIKKFALFSYIMAGLFFVSLFTTILSGYFATQFYQSSVLTQSEMKENILNQIKNQGDIIVEKDYYKALNNEKIILSQFLNKSGDFKEMYNLYRDGIVESNKKEVFFEKAITENLNNVH